ncbi:putative helicase [Burkholderia pseudomallei]|nr:putative helicase [Burkholderia pseudomallei]
MNRLAKQDQSADWVQKRSERLGLHCKQNDGLNIWTCQVTGPSRSLRLHGYLLRNASSLFIEVPPNTPYLTLDHFSGRAHTIPHQMACSAAV